MMEFDLNNCLPKGSRQGSSQTSALTERKYGILVADDDGGVRNLLNKGLHRQGFEVWLAADGQKALELFWRHREMIDLVLLDV